MSHDPDHRLLYESHCHTPLCKHAFGEPEEYARTAWERGLRGVIFTCHSPLPDGLSPQVRMALDEYPVYRDMVARAREAWAGKLQVGVGLESDFLPGLEPYLEKLHARAPLDHVLGSVHPQMQPYRQTYWKGDWDAYVATYFDLLAAAAETGLFDTLSHPDLIKNENPDHWEVGRVLDVIRRALDRIAATGVAMELNTSGLNKALPEVNPGPVILGEMAGRGIPVVIGADAHVPDRVGDGFVEALDLLEECGFREVARVFGRQRSFVSISRARASLAPVA
ncbi:MAG: histidinol-phosphatase HisJ family protein [Puniceicoccaceae bacterium]|nr:MAG: histidinol-phosphatase HisJ family protein [Puniceicoccaceae bacterium]